MIPESSETRRAPGWPDYLLCYALYALLLVMGFVVVFVLWPRALNSLIVLIFGLNWGNRLVRQLGIYLVGAGLFLLAMGAEPYLRNGVARRDLLRRFLRLAIPLGAFGVICVVIDRLAIILMTR